MIRPLPSRPPRDERGVVAPARVVLVAFVIVAVAAVTFLLTNNGSTKKPTAQTTGGSPSATPSSRASSPSSTPSSSGSPSAKVAPVKRADTVVEVFNNSGITGLAARTSAKAKAAGWNVVGSGNWYGTIPATTVYYPPRLKRAAKLLARDLGIGRLMPAVDPMRLDRLTVILTRDYG